MKGFQIYEPTMYYTSMSHLTPKIIIIIIIQTFHTAIQKISSAIRAHNQTKTKQKKENGLNKNHRKVAKYETLQ